MWTVEADAAFLRLERIKEMLKLYFVDEEGELILETDASEYGIGVYLYYVLPKSDEPIAF